VQGTVPQCQFRILVANEVNRTNFSGPAWIAFSQRYGLAPLQKLVLWLDEGDDAITFHFPEPGGYVSSEEELEEGDGGAFDVVVVSDLSP
jgi:hypothetical protein